LIQGKRKITDGIVILHCKNYFFLINFAIFEVFVPKWQTVFSKWGAVHQTPQQWYIAHKICCGVGHIGIAAKCSVFAGAAPEFTPLLRCSAQGVKNYGNLRKKRYKCFSFVPPFCVLYTPQSLAQLTKCGLFNCIISMHCSMRTVVSCAVRDCVCDKLPFCNMAEEISSDDEFDNHMSHVSDDSQQAASRKRRLDNQNIKLSGHVFNCMAL
jgi:hypothetical protein